MSELIQEVDIKKIKKKNYVKNYELIKVECNDDYCFNCQRVNETLNLCNSRIKNKYYVRHKESKLEKIVGSTCVKYYVDKYDEEAAQLYLKNNYRGKKSYWYKCFPLNDKDGVKKKVRKYKVVFGENKKFGGHWVAVGASDKNRFLCLWVARQRYNTTLRVPRLKEPGAVMVWIFLNRQKLKELYLDYFRKYNREETQTFYNNNIERFENKNFSFK